jgi:squalene cyclase
MVSAGRVAPDALDRAAALVVVHQGDDGSWRLSESQTLGGPTFYGTSLATAMAWRTLRATRTRSTEPALAKAGGWLRSTNPVTVLDASSVLFGLDRDVDAAAVTQRQKCLDILKRGQGPDGGWGPYLTSQSEPFDTALAVLALAGAGNEEMIARARDYLVKSQNDDGSWPETTRPPNGESYAQRISTTAWALLALLQVE